MGAPASLDPSRVALLNFYGGNHSGAAYGFNNPSGIAFDGTHLWVANEGNSTITEVNASTGTALRTLTDASYDFDQPYSITFDGTDLWVANSAGNNLTEIAAANGALVRVVGTSANFNDPVASAFDGQNLWVTNSGSTGTASSSVTEVNVATGAVVQTLSNATNANYAFTIPIGIAADGAGHMFVANFNPNRASGKDSVTEFNASNGTWVTTLNDASYKLVNPDAIAFDGTNMWVASAQTGTVTEFAPSNGALVRTIATSGVPEAFAFDGSAMWVSESNSTVVKIDPATGAIRVISGPELGLNQTDGLAFDGAEMWVTNELPAGSITDLNTGG